MQHIHAIIWLDHLQAEVIGFSSETSEIEQIVSQSPNRQLHRKSGTMGNGHAPDDLNFFEEVSAAVEDVREVLVAGPGTAKIAFKKFVDKKHPDLAKRIVAVEAMDHKTDGQLLDFARKYFKKYDQLGGLA